MIPGAAAAAETLDLLVAQRPGAPHPDRQSEEQARLTSERESLRNSLLAALSHDLRTPLTAVLFWPGQKF